VDEGFVDINSKEYWKEIIQLTFVKENYEYLSITRLPYEDQIYIEHDDQINYLYFYYNDLKYKSDDFILTLEILKPIKGTLPNMFIIEMTKSLDNLNEILNTITKWKIIL
jgi:hypothetical protein